MFNQKDILAALQNGSKAEDLAQSFTKALNAAIAEKKAADELAIGRQMKKDMLNEILNRLADFFEEFYPDIYDEDMRKSVETDKLINIFDVAYEEVKNLPETLFGTIPTDVKLPKENFTKYAAASDSIVDPITAFLKKHNL